ncbi:RNA methyltransferase [Candidatus Phytoplasma solani]|uniref:TrmH family RNA methyltransferase n=1 Tax=Candidatus Phytoplasma solani TaxID=69896 RepID=UPI0032DAE5C7
MITSNQNPTFKKLKKLKLKKYRDLYQQFLVYGNHLIEQSQKTLYQNTLIEIYTSTETKEGTLISPILMKELSQTKTVFDQIALCRVPLASDLLNDKILALENIQDPANLGALMRSALAFGFHQIFVSFHSADFYHEKTVRVSQGALFELALQRGNLKNFLENLKNKDYRIFSTSPHKTNFDIQTSQRYLKKVLVLGNEGTGISPLIESLSDGLLKIETQKVESLNVAIAGSILMYLL